MPQMRQVRIRRRIQKGRGAVIPQGVLQVQYVQQDVGLNQPELPRDGSLLQDLPWSQVWP